MANEHAPIQIGLPEEPAWQVAEPMATALVAFLSGDAPPDPGEVFLACGRAFGGEPQDVEALPIADPRVAWGFAFRAPRREARVLIWCEEADASQMPDASARSAQWVLSLETLLEASGAVDDCARLLRALRDASGDALLLVLDPGLGAMWKPAALDEVLAENGGLLDERSIYRVEVFARDRTNGPFWLSTVGLARVAKPELEALEIPAARLGEALELVDALAARFVGESLPGAGVPFEAGPALAVALVPAREAAETVAPESPGGLADRTNRSAHPRAAICDARQRGSFRKVWQPPLDVLAALADGTHALALASRVALVRERHARRAYPALAEVLAEVRGVGARVLAKIAPQATTSDATPSALWIEIVRADRSGGEGRLVRSAAPDERSDVVTSSGATIPFTLEEIADWRVEGFRPELPVVGPQEVHLLRATNRAGASNSAAPGSAR